MYVYCADLGRQTTARVIGLPSKSLSAKTLTVTHDKKGKKGLRQLHDKH
jgi:hypothetical protein